MSCDDSAKHENKENIIIDMDNIQRQLIADEEKYLVEQKNLYEV